MYRQKLRYWNSYSEITDFLLLESTYLRFGTYLKACLLKPGTQKHTVHLSSAEFGLIMSQIFHFFFQFEKKTIA